MREVRAVGLPIVSPKVDIANVRVEFESGCVANFTASRVSTETVRKLRFFEPRQYVSIDYARRDLLVIAHRREHPAGNCSGHCCTQAGCRRAGQTRGRRSSRRRSRTRNEFQKARGCARRTIAPRTRIVSRCGANASRASRHSTPGTQCACTRTRNSSSNGGCIMHGVLGLMISSNQP